MQWLEWKFLDTVIMINCQLLETVGCVLLKLKNLQRYACFMVFLEGIRDVITSAIENVIASAIEIRNN